MHLTCPGALKDSYQERSRSGWQSHRMASTTKQEVAMAKSASAQPPTETGPECRGLQAPTQAVYTLGVLCTYPEDVALCAPLHRT